MTFAPPTLVDLGRYLVAHDVVNLGVVGDTAHAAKGTSYHLGADQLAVGAYSAILPRDKAGLSNAASAIDLGKFEGSFVGLRAFSVWLVARCQANDPGTGDIREVIFSPDSEIVQRWDNYAKKLYLGGTGTGQGDDSHKYHTHVSFPRDSEFRDKIALINRYFSPIAVQEDDVDPKVDVPVGRCNVAAGGSVYGDPAKGTVLIPSWVGAQGVQVYSQRVGLTAIRIDLASGTAADLRIGWVGNDKVTIVSANTDAATLEGRRFEWDRQNVGAKVALAPKP